MALKSTQAWGSFDSGLLALVARDKRQRSDFVKGPQSRSFESTTFDTVTAEIFSGLGMSNLFVQQHNMDDMNSKSIENHL